MLQPFVFLLDGCAQGEFDRGEPYRVEVIGGKIYTLAHSAL